MLSGLLFAFWMVLSSFNSSTDTLKESVSGWRDSGKSWKKNPWKVITDVGITFAVRITSAEAGLRVLLGYLLLILGWVLPSIKNQQVILRSLVVLGQFFSLIIIFSCCCYLQCLERFSVLWHSDWNWVINICNVVLLVVVVVFTEK